MYGKPLASALQMSAEYVTRYLLFFTKYLLSATLYSDYSIRFVFYAVDYYFYGIESKADGKTHNTKKKYRLFLVFVCFYRYPLKSILVVYINRMHKWKRPRRAYETYAY